MIRLSLAAPRALLLLALAALCWSAWAAPAPAAAAPPATPRITEPAVDGASAHPADVHMEAVGFRDRDGHAHACSRWEIRERPSGRIAWRSNGCAGGVEKVHIHFGDGRFAGRYAGRTQLLPKRRYLLRVRFRDSAGEASPWARRRFRTIAAGPPGFKGRFPWVATRPSFVVEPVAQGLQLPVAIAVVPEPGPAPDDPLLYVAELYGAIKVLTRDGRLLTYAHGLLNFNPAGQLPGSGVRGIGGIAIEPETGDLFATLVYRHHASARTPKPFFPRVIRLHSAADGRSATGVSTVLDMAGEKQGQSHQISNVTIGPDGKLYVHNGDGFVAKTARNLNSFRGKILRLELDGSAPPDNPFYDAGDGITARDYVFARGFRNPFGGAWRAANGVHYQVENGPSVDRFSRVDRGLDYRWNGSNRSMRAHALYNWSPSTAPVSIAFVEPETHGGSGFPAAMMDRAFVTESGPTWATGRVPHGKRITMFAPRASGELGGPPRPFVRYIGVGKATAAGLAAGPDGLYFTDLFKDRGYRAPTDPGARLLRVRFAPPCPLDVEALVGTPGAEVLRGTPGIDRIFGRGGDDRLYGLGGRDCLYGQGGNDRLFGGPGPDLLRGGPGRDLLFGGPGRDALHGGPGADRLFGGPGRDALFGGPGADVLIGGPGRDRIFGGPGPDRIYARDGARDLIDCGPGRDVAVVDRRDRVRNCEVVRRAGIRGSGS